MRYIKKRMVSLILTVCMVLSITSCSKKQIGISANTTSNIQTTENVTKETATSKPDTTKATEKETDISSDDGGYVAPAFAKIANGTKGSKEFSDYCTELFKKEATENLIDYHYLVSDGNNFGITEYSKDFGEVDYSNPSDTSKLNDILNKLSEFNYSKLTDTQKETFEVLYDELTTDIANSKYALIPYVFGKTFGAQINTPLFLAEYTLNNENDVKEYLDLLNGLKGYYEDLIAYENERIKAGYPMSDQMINSIIEQCEAFKADPENNYLIATFNDRIVALSDIPEETRNAYIDKNKHIVLESVIPAYSYLVEQFKGMLGKGAKTGGITNYKEFRGYMEYFLKSSVGTDKTPDEVQALLEKYAKASFTALQAAMYKNSSILDNLEDPEFIESEPEKITEDLLTKIFNDFPTVPDVTVKYHTVHPSLSDFMSPAFYITSPVDNYKVQNIYINNGASNSFSGLYPTVAHEGYPGHLYQNLYYSNVEHEYVRDIMNFTGYSEGWATYVEMMSYNYGISDKTLASALANYNVYELCLYGEIDLGVNYYGWNRDKLTKFVRESFGMANDEIIDSFLEAVSEKPGNYLHYIFGYIEFMEMKSKASKALGSKFNLKQFNKFLLDFGPAPFYIIDEHLDEWIEKQK